MKLNSIGQLSLIVTALSLVGFTTSPAIAATFYNVLDLGTPSSVPEPSIATGINDLGQVIGTIELSQGGRYSFRTAPNSPINVATDIVLPGGDEGVPGSDSVPSDINNSGQVVGSVYAAGFITGPNGATRLEAYGFSFYRPYAINDLGQVAGEDIVTDPITSSSVSRAVVTTSGGGDPIVDLGTLGGSNSFGRGINNLGQVVGASGTANGQIHGFRTAANSVINVATDDLGTLGGNFSSAIDINDLGQTVGFSTTASGETHAFLTDASSPIDAEDDLGTLGGDFSIASGINESGLVVGDSELADGSARAFLYDGTELFDLNTLLAGDADFVLTSASDINENGQIAATGFFADTQTTRAVLLTPVPEPASMLGVLAFGAGAGFLRTRAAKRKVRA